MVAINFSVQQVIVIDSFDCYLNNVGHQVVLSSFQQVLNQFFVNNVSAMTSAMTFFHLYSPVFGLLSFFKTSILKHLFGVARLSRISCCSSTIIVFRQTDHLSDCWCSDSSASNIALTWSEMSFVHASIYSTYVLADGRLKVSVMTFCFPGL